jgi:threonine synthase
MSDSYYLGGLACVRCGAPIAEADAFMGCPRCAADGVSANVLARYDLTGLTELPVAAGEPGLFRYRDLLPLRPETRPVSLGEGGTPLVHLERFGAQRGFSRLLLKDEARNPTWSYKDRLAAVAVTKAREAGVSRIVVSSSGNHGAATAAYSAAAGIDCVVLTIASVPETMKVLMQSYSAHVLAFRTPEDRWHLMRQLVSERGWMPMSGFLDPPAGSNPFGIDGYKTIAYEIFTDLGAAPDVVLVPVAYGDGLVGIHRGFVDLRDIGLIDRVPRLVAVDPLGAYEAGLKHGVGTCVPDVDSVAFSISVPCGTFQALHAIQDSGGAAITGAPDRAIMQHQQLLARSEGLYLEASSAITLTVLPELLVRGLATPDDTVVAIGTSSGLKDVGATAELLTSVPVVEPKLEALDRLMGAS